MQAADAERIVAIYNQSIRTKGHTADLDELTVEDRKEWFTEHEDPRYPVFVACEGNDIMGWISVSPYRKGRRALAEVAEISLYIDAAYRGRGVGSDMMQHTIAFCRNAGFEHLIGIIIASNDRSQALFKKSGFVLWGRMPGIVAIDGEHFDHVYYGRHL
ncbi:GNAT family N-acetyltransferase [Rurimicrobium arvi]|uniref:GNAT family N-acetyltransferase n=2 Tax=Rurimicrobium arvi TaxID=2049916 RepID=A0ABP8MQW1_9BACT